nr:MAG TPA: hypothetical protein [Caudoviricetes sp.]DAY54166.1 MAG TPA: hypothetical protein [Caudoviricetes sp.]
MAEWPRFTTLRLSLVEKLGCQRQDVKTPI